MGSAWVSPWSVTFDPIVGRSTIGDRWGPRSAASTTSTRLLDTWFPRGRILFAVTGPRSCYCLAQLGLLSWPAGFPLHRLSLPGDSRTSVTATKAVPGPTAGPPYHRRTRYSAPRTTVARTDTLPV